MDSSVKSKRLRIGGMTCINCQKKIEKKLRNIAGVKSVNVSYSAGTADVTYDTDIVSLYAIDAAIEKLDYKVLTDREKQAPDTNRIIGLLIIIVSLYMFLEFFGILNLLIPSQLAEINMGYGMMFIIGLITSVHCIAMCGGINLSQCVCVPHGNDTEENRLSAIRPELLYNLGRVVSYTAVGFVVGALGSAITFTNTVQGVLKLIAGMFMVVMGINMLGIFPWLRKLNPRMPKIFTRKIESEKGKSNSPLIVGLLNGFMPCGPLQAMQIYALSTGNPFTGALSMFLFSMGTVPLMFGLGALTSVIGKKFTSKVMTVGAVLVVVLGLSMLTQGWNLSGLSDITASGTAVSQSGEQDVVIEDGFQIINSTLSWRGYPAITVQAGTPVKWVINAPQGSINGCNNRIFINEYGIEYTFKTGENIIEFTPLNTGTFRYSCWMGMIRSTITVAESRTEGARYASTEIPVSIKTPAPTDNTQESDSSTGFESLSEPIPANVTIPTDTLAIAEVVEEDGYKFQKVMIELTDEGFSPGVAVVQSRLETMWVINNKSSKGVNFSILVPAYKSEVWLDSGENPLYFFPAGSFDFSNANNQFYGYMKVVDNLNAIDRSEIKKEAENYQTIIWPSATFKSGVSCH